MSYGSGDEFRYDLGTERGYPLFSDMAAQPLTQRVRDRKHAAAIADGVARGYGPLNVRQTSWPENLAQYENAGVSAHYGYGHHQSPVPYQAHLRRADIDTRQMQIDESWEQSCKAPERPAKTIGKFSEQFSGGLPDRSTLNPDLVMMFILFVLLIVIAQCMRSMWKLSADVVKLREKVARLEG